MLFLGLLHAYELKRAQRLSACALEGGREALEELFTESPANLSQMPSEKKDTAVIVLKEGHLHMGLLSKATQRQTYIHIYIYYVYNIHIYYIDVPI